MRYAVTDPAGVVLNIILLDAPDDFDPGEGRELIELDDDSRVDIGWTLSGHTPDPPELPVEPEPEPAPPTELEQLRALVEQLQRSVADQQAQLDEVADLMVGVL